MNGNNPAEIEKGSVYADLGATVTDNVNQNLGYKTFLDGVLISQISLDTSTTTTYTIDYVATDQAGNTATTTRTVVVKDSASGISNNQFPISNEGSNDTINQAETATSTPVSSSETTIPAADEPAPDTSGEETDVSVEVPTTEPISEPTTEPAPETGASPAQIE